MYEKFNKEEIWGHLGKSNKPRLEDNEGDEKENDGNYTEEEEEEYGLPVSDTKVRLQQRYTFLNRAELISFFCSLFMSRTSSIHCLAIPSIASL